MSVPGWLGIVKFSAKRPISEPDCNLKANAVSFCSWASWVEYIKRVYHLGGSLLRVHLPIRHLPPSSMGCVPALWTKQVECRVRRGKSITCR